jgi:hypothetical protein
MVLVQNQLAADIGVTKLVVLYFTLKNTPAKLTYAGHFGSLSLFLQI